MVDLSANTISFSEGLTKAGQIAANSSKNIQRSLSLIGVSAAAMATAVTAAMTEVISKTEDFAFAIQKSAEEVGTSSEMFSKLAYNAKLAGVPIETLDMAMARLARTSYSAQSGNKEAVSAYAALGISVKDLTGPLKDSGDLFVKVSQSLDKFRDSTSKTGLEQKLLGRSGAELAPLLLQVANGFDTASQQATLFGVVIGDKTAAQAKQLHESMIQLESVALGFSLRLLSGVSPALQDVAAQMVKVATSSDGMKTISNVAHDLADVVHGAGDAFVFLAEHANAAKIALEGLAAIKFASFFAPMIVSASKAQMGVGGIALAAGDLVGRMAGLPKIATNLTKMTTSGLETARIIGMIATQESYAAAGAAAWDLALAPITVSLGLITGALGLLSIGVIAVGKHMLDVDSAAEKMSGGAVTWGDHWTAACNQIIDRFRVLKLEVDKLAGTMDSDDKETQNFVNKYGLLGKSITQAVADAAAARRMGESAGNYAPTHPAVAAAKKDAPALPSNTPAKVDQIKLKLAELANAAAAAKKSLADAGKGLDFQRADEIATQYTKTLLEMETAAKRQKTTVTDAQKAQALNSITVAVNDASQAKFNDTLIKGTEQIDAQVAATDLLTAAIGKSAAARRAAQVDSEYKVKTASMDPDWLRMNQDLLNQQKAARSNELSSGDRQKDASSLDALRQQVSVQEMLNAAIAKGADAREAANLAAEQMAIRQSFIDRGDSDQTALKAALDANEKLYDAKKKQSDLDAAVGMNPSLVYQDQAARLRNIAEAANEAGISISKMQMDAASKANWDSYLDSINKTKLAVGSASDGVSVFFNQMVTQSESAAQQMHDILGGAFESLNSTLEKLVSGQKASFADMFRGIASQLAKAGIQKTEQGIVGMLTGNKGQGPDATVTAINQSNTYLKGILGVMTAQSGSKGVSKLGGLFPKSGSDDDSDDDSDSSGGGGNVFSTLLGALFGGHRALGGDVTAGMSYDVGEMGRETFVPKTNGSIIPNSRTGGGGHTFNIDARGANDPAQTEAAVHRVMGQYIPHIVSASVKANHEQNMRRPSSAR